MYRLISLEESKGKRCHYCDTWLSVKYMVDTKELDRVYYGVEGNVCCCDKCIKRHYIGNKVETEL